MKVKIVGGILLLSSWMLSGMAPPGFAQSDSPPKLDEQSLEERLKALERKVESTSAGFDWLNHFTFHNDFRLRHETLSIYNPATGMSDYSRERIRFRFGGEYVYDGEWRVGFRLATGTPDNPAAGSTILHGATIASGSNGISTNQNLGSGFDKKPIWLDQAYAAYAHDFTVFKGTIAGGKFEMPFFTTSQLLWDKDLNPEGLGEQFVIPAGVSTNFFANFGQFALNNMYGVTTANTVPTSAQPYLFAYQAGVDHRIGHGFGTFKVGAAYYDFLQLKGKILPYYAGANALTGAGVLANDYKVVNIAGAWILNRFFLPVTLHGEYADNVAGNVVDLYGNRNRNTGWLAGIRAGGTPQKFGDFAVWYYHKALASETTVDIFPDSEFHANQSATPGTNAQGDVFGFVLGLRKGVELDITYYNTRQIIGSAAQRNLIQADMLFYF